jgi:leader peptidase (prepilin peptidase)/N-methyltransferase
MVAADPTTPVAVRLARFAVYFAFTGVLIVLSFIDLRTQLLPDAITLPAIPVLFLAGFGAHDVDWLDRLIGAGAGYLVLRLISDFYYYVLKREGLGLGDAKLLALIGAVLGWRALFFVVFIAGLSGAAISIPVVLWSRRKNPETGGETALRHVQVPFGPFLAAAAIVYLLVGQILLQMLAGQ